MHRFYRLALSCSAIISTLAFGQTPTVLRDLDANGRVTLTKDELGQLMPNAKMGRLNAKGEEQLWSNDPGGSLVVSSDNRNTGGRRTTAQGKWHLSDDGRYCVLIEWRSVGAEEWCRYIVKAGPDYYAANSDKSGTERVYRLQISK
jgi:hypothetical protein